MKLIVIIMLAALTMVAAGPAFSAEMTKSQRDECLLASKGCVNEVNSIQQKIKKLQVEIKKGTKVYSPDEIKKLKDILKEAETLLDNMLTNP